MEIKRIVDMEINKLHKRRAETNAKLNEAAVDLAIATVHPSVRQMAMHNATLTQARAFEIYNIVNQLTTYLVT